jgi:FSR family fosmidomycin resistance protein-like MFS transporter
MDRLRLAALVLGHSITDCYMGMVLPLLPIVRDRLDLSLAQVGYLTVCISVASSLAQPLLGWLSDRTRSAYLVGFGVALTGVGVSTFGRADSFWPMILLLAIGGLGCGSFHPAGAALAGRTGGERRDLALAVFSPGGIVGYSLGPIIGIWLYHQLGLRHMWPAMIAGLVLGPAIGGLVARLDRQGEGRDRDTAPPVYANGEAIPRRIRLALLALLLLVVFCRSGLIIAFTNFLAQLLDNRGLPEGLWGYVTGAFVFGGGLAGLIGGYVAHRVGRRWLTVITLGLAGPALLFFLHSQSSATWLLLVTGGALAQAAVPVNIVQAQMLLPSRQSLASALTMGFCWGAASFLAPIVGHIADRTTLTFALSLICAIPVAGAVLAAFLPELRSAREFLPPAEPPSLPPPLAKLEEG